MERANYKGRFNLRVSLATREKLCGDRRERKPRRHAGERSIPSFGGRKQSPHFRAKRLHGGRHRLVGLAFLEQLRGDLEGGEDGGAIGLDHRTGGKDLSN